jgi:multicomponent Na+:H+ antiporter subunit C
VTPNITLLIIIGALYAAGVYMVLERSLTRVLLGLLLMGNATNVLLLASGGAAGNAPIYGASSIDDMSDPLAQAMILTAIVITLGMAAFMLALIHRRWQIDQEDDDVDDDTEDRLVASQMTHADIETHEHTDYFGEHDHR